MTNLNTIVSMGWAAGKAWVADQWPQENKGAKRSRENDRLHLHPINSDPMTTAIGLQARHYSLNLHPSDNHAIRLLASHLHLSLRDTVHLLITDYLSHNPTDIHKIFEHPEKIFPPRKLHHPKDL